MGNHIAEQLIKKMKTKNIKIAGAKVLVMGLTFKENCADTRNSGIKKVINKLKGYRCDFDLYDPWTDQNQIKKFMENFQKQNFQKNIMMPC